MRLYLDRAFAFYTRSQHPWMDVEVKEPITLRELIENAGIPAGEVHLVAINGEAIESLDILVTGKDNIKIFPPFGGG